MILERKSGHVTKSSTTPEIPASDIFISMEAKNSAKDVCLTLQATVLVARSYLTDLSYRPTPNDSK